MKKLFDYLTCTELISYNGYDYIILPELHPTGDGSRWFEFD